MLKATRMSGGSEIQGKLFGILEGGRGLLPMIWGMAILTLFNYLWWRNRWIRGAISHIPVSRCWLVFLILSFQRKKVEDESDASTEKGNLKEELLYVLKLPGLLGFWQ